MGKLITKLKYIGKDTDVLISNTIYRIMFNEEATKRFKNIYMTPFWEDDKLVRIVFNENPYKGTLILNPNMGSNSLWEPIYD